jgi:hypothetical protein
MRFLLLQKVLKVGFDLSNDLMMLAKACSEWESLVTDMKNVVDLRVLKSEILRKVPRFFPDTNGSGKCFIVSKRIGVIFFILTCCMC